MKTWLNQKSNLPTVLGASQDSIDAVSRGVDALGRAVAATAQMQKDCGDTLDLGRCATKALSGPELSALSESERHAVFSSWLESGLPHCPPLPSMVRASLGWTTSCPKVASIPTNMMMRPDAVIEAAWREAFRPEATRERIDLLTSRGTWHARRGNPAQAAADFGCALVYVRQNRQSARALFSGRHSAEEARLFALTLEHLANHRDDRTRESERVAARRFPKLFKYTASADFVDGPFPLLAASVVQRLIVGDNDGQSYIAEAQCLWMWLGRALKVQKTQRAHPFYQTVQGELDAATLRNPVLFGQQEELGWAISMPETHDLIAELPPPDKGWLSLTHLRVDPTIARFVQALESGATARRSLLLEGAPGVGKSSLVEAIFRHARMSNTNLVLFRATVQKFLSGTFSQTAQNLSQTLERMATLSAPPHKRQIIIWIDEIDGLAISRTHDTSAENNRITTTLFPFLDDSQRTRTQNLFFIGTTNCSEVLDPAILSRFSFVTKIEMPPAETRLRMLDQTFAAPHPLSWTRHGSPCFRSLLAAGTVGLTLRDLSRVANELTVQSADGLALYVELSRVQNAQGVLDPFAAISAKETAHATLLATSSASDPFFEKRREAVEHLLSLCEASLLREALFVAQAGHLEAARLIQHIACRLEVSAQNRDHPFISRVSERAIHVAFPFAQNNLLYSRSPIGNLKPNNFQVVVTPSTIVLITYDIKREEMTQHLFSTDKGIRKTSEAIDFSPSRWAIQNGPSEKTHILATREDNGTSVTTFRRRPLWTLSWFIRLEQAAASVDVT